MRIRQKLLLLLLAITMLPLVLVVWSDYRHTRNLARDLYHRATTLTGERFTSQLRQMVEFSAALLNSQQGIVELALQVQAGRVESLLARPAPKPRPVYFVDQYTSGNHPPPGLEPSEQHLRFLPDGTTEPLRVSYKEQVMLLAPRVSRASVSKDIARLSYMTRVYRTLNRSHRRLFFWQYTALENGLHSSYPGHAGYPKGYDPRRRPWYRLARQANHLVWSPPYVDAATRQLIMTASLPVHRPDGSFAGVTAIDVQILTVLREMRLRTAMPEDVRPFLVALGNRDNKPLSGIRIIAHQGYGSRGRDWQAALTLDWLGGTDKKGMSHLLADMKEDKSGLLRMPYQGQDSLWAYERLSMYGTYLLFIVPYREVTSRLDEIGGIIQTETAKQLRNAWVVSIAVILAVGLLAFVCSRTVTAPLRRLADAARRLAKGDLETRAEVRSSDEIGELGVAFNEMVPQLADRIQVRQALAMAMEVQQSLLPAAAPHVPGFQIAGHSIYCDETGGDYYDFIELSPPEDKRVAIAVGDVSGHGIASALLMATVRGMLRSRTNDREKLGELIGFINRRLANEARRGRFVTLFYLVLEGRTHSMRWVNAGHDLAFLYDPARDSFEELKATDIPLGIRPDWSYSESTRENGVDGRILVIGTDGIWDARSPKGEMFGKERLREVVCQNAGASAQEICDAVTQALNTFRDAEPPHDDVTMVIVKSVPKDAPA